MADFYASGHCMVYTSQHEGFGMAPIEAMACGLPVITTPGGALQEVSGGGAWVLTSYQAEELAAAMVGFIENQQFPLKQKYLPLALANRHGQPL